MVIFFFIILNDEINKNRKQLTEKDIGLVSELVYGVTAWKLTLDTIVKKYSKIKLKKIIEFTRIVILDFILQFLQISSTLSIVLFFINSFITNMF